MSARPAMAEMSDWPSPSSASELPRDSNVAPSNLRGSVDIDAKVASAKERRVAHGSPRGTNSIRASDSFPS